VPYFVPRDPVKERKLFITSLNTLTMLARKNAIITRATQKLFFDLDKRRITLESETAAKNDKGESIFEPAKNLRINRTFAIPSNIEFRNFYIEGFDEMAKSDGRMVGQMWFFIVPNGMTQAVTINFVDMAQKVKGKPVEVGLVLNPFSAKFERYDKFQK